MEICLALTGRKCFEPLTQGGASLALGYPVSGFQPGPKFVVTVFLETL